MNYDVICLYYSRTGKTERVAQEIAAALDCDVVEIQDRAKRDGALGALRCGLDAMRKKTRRLKRFVTRGQVWEYKLVILATPVWAGRCSSVMRGFLKRRGLEIENVAYVITHSSDEPYRTVFDQMDLYVNQPRVAEVSLRPGSAGYIFWRDQFLKNCADFLGCGLKDIPEEAENGAETEQ